METLWLVTEELTQGFFTASVGWLTYNNNHIFRPFQKSLKKKKSLYKKMKKKHHNNNSIAVFTGFHFVFLSSDMLL